MRKVTMCVLGAVASGIGGGLMISGYVWGAALLVPGVILLVLGAAA